MMRVLVLVSLVFLSGLSAFATTFGPIPIVEQVEQAPYVIRGYIESRWVDMDRETNRPYTFFKMRMEEQLQGPEALSGQVTLRSPGGEMNGIGYNVPGRADFAEGEQVVVMARMSREAGILDVFGLASGKYTVVDKNGTNVLRNGLGMTLSDNSGKELSLDEFRSLVERVKNHSTSGHDLTVIVNREAEHSREFAEVLHGSAPTASGTVQNSQNLTHTIQEKDVTKREPSSEKSSTGLPEDSWFKVIAIAIVMIAFLLVVMFFLRKHNED